MNPAALPVGWTTADYALIVSVVSLCFAVASFVWNVWSKFIYPKARVEVSAAITVRDRSTPTLVSMRHPALPGRRHFPEGASLPALKAEAINHGPGKVLLDTVLFSSGGFFHSRKHGFHVVTAYADYPNNLSSGTFKPKCMENHLDVGETASVFFPLTDELMNRIGPYRVGFRDSFGRLHWCTRREAKHLRAVINDLKQLSIP